jgi:type IV pilus assembly protein PilM
VLGLDWGGNSSLKYVLLRRTTVGLKLQVETFGRVSVNADAPEAVYEISQALHELFMRERRLKKAKVVIGLGTERVILRKESFPSLTAKELKQTVTFGIQKDLGLEGEDTPIVCDSLAIGADPAVQGNTEYLNFGAEARMVSERASAFSDQGVIPVKVVPNILALKNLLDKLPKTKSSDAVCFLVIGASRSILVFFKNGQVDFYREIVIGGDDFTKAITGTIFHEGRAIQFTTKEALEFKYKHGYPLGFSEGMTFRGAPLTEVGAMMRPVVERLTGEIHRSIGFYSEKTGGQSVKVLYMMGGGAQLRHLSEVLSERLGIPTSVMPVPDAIRVSGGIKQEQLFKSKYMEYGIALSLALETNAKGNLLPVQFSKMHRMAFIQRCLNWAAVAVLTAVGIVYFFDTLSFKNMKNLKVTRERTAEFVSRKVIRYESNLKLRSAVTENLIQFDQKISQNPTCLNVLRSVTRAMPKSLSLVSVRIGAEPEAGTNKGRSAAPPKRPLAGEENSAAKVGTKPLRIEGKTKLSIPDIRISVAQFMLELSKSGYITDVKLQDETLDDKNDEYLFVIEGTVNP